MTRYDAGLIVAAGFEIETNGALEFALVLFEVRPAVRAGSLDLLEIRLCDRRGVCHLASLSQSTRRGVRGSSRHLRVFLQTL